jgi:hypothetical protein
VDNTTLSWNTGGNASWFGQRSTYFYGGDAAQSGMISHNQESWIQTTVSGPGTLGFYWNVTSEANKDFLEFYIDDIRQDRISGSVDWHQKSYNLSSGSNTLKWRYMKDGNVNSSSDCGWLYNVEFTASPVPTPTSTTTAPLPSPVVIPIDSWENPQVEIENQAHLSITVTISGPSSETIYLSPGDTKTRQLSPSEYSIYATATGVIPYSGSITLSKEYKYIWQFYISQVP